MRIGILGSRGYPSTYGGFETLVRRLAPHLREGGHDVFVYCRDGTPRTEMRDNIQCITTLGLDRKTTSTLSFGFTASIDARRRRLDAALILNCANGVFLPLFRGTRTRTLVNVDGIEWERAKWSRFGRTAFKIGAQSTARHADEVIVDSLAIGEIWKQKFSRESRFIPYGGDAESPGSERVTALGVTPGTYLLAVARLVPENNIDLLLDAWELLDPRPPLLVVGSATFGDPLEARLGALAAADPLVTWLGHVDDQVLLHQLWANCALYFHGHSAGGTNPSLVQAMGLGAPIIAVDTVFNREVLACDQQLVDANGPAIASRIGYLLRNAAVAEHYARAGHERVQRYYRWDHVLDDYAAALTGRVQAVAG